MAVTSVTAAAHPAEPTNATASLTTLTSTGSGNGFQFAYSSALLCVFHNDSGSSATVTLKVPQPTAYSDRSITIPDDTFTIANNETFHWVPNELFRDSNKNVEVEADQLIKVKVFSDLSRS